MISKNRFVFESLERAYDAMKNQYDPDIRYGIRVNADEVTVRAYKNIPDRVRLSEDLFLGYLEDY
jgi:hypothetical protein|tara:strand:+ start:79 stop:273 length:195 start_codon:yes stop_codon:yes gene_type:complete